MLDADYRPLAAPERAPERPKFPHRLRHFMYACAKTAGIMEEKMRDTRLAPESKMPTRPKEAAKGVVLPPGVNG